MLASVAPHPGARRSVARTFWDRNILVLRVSVVDSPGEALCTDRTPNERLTPVSCVGMHASFGKTDVLDSFPVSHGFDPLEGHTSRQ